VQRSAPRCGNGWNLAGGQSESQQNGAPRKSCAECGMRDDCSGCVRSGGTPRIMPQKTGRQLIKEWGIPCDYGLLSDWGNFYALPKQFPVALIDSTGFVIFDRQEDLIAQGAALGKRLNVPARISSLPGYQYRWVGGLGPRLPEELTGTKYWEGVSTKVLVNRYEREPRARMACLEHYGYRCCGCGLLMSEKYGARAEGLIHVHHIIPLANVEEGYEVDPIKDLRPTCPNCHAVIHCCDPPLSLEELTKAIKAQKGASHRPDMT